ncbi:MAG: hypothetical protein GY792_14405 [Gammaproteobacteria bacterium]|nr:hypothetical protein [Gammaproteobacteria bacterium]
MVNFEQKMESIKHVLEVGEDTIAASECLKLVEQVLRHLFSQYQDRVDESVRQKVQEAVRQRDKRKEGVEGLTMGQLVHVLLESKFIDACARVTGKSLNSILVVNFEKLTHLRNKVIHNGAEATHAEAEFLFDYLKVLLETFEVLNNEKPGNSGKVQVESSHKNSQVSGASDNMKSGRIIRHVGRDYIEHAAGPVLSGHINYGDHAQQILNTDPSQASREDILVLLSTIQQKLEKLSLPQDVKKEAAHEIDGAKIQIEKEPPNKKKMVEKLKSAGDALKEAGTLGQEAVSLGNLLGQAITWGGETWIKWMM